MIYQTQSGAEYDGNLNFAKKDLTFFPASTPSNIADMTQIPSEIEIAEVTDIFHFLDIQQPPNVPIQGRERIDET